jgi:hypothetical protein
MNVPARISFPLLVFFVLLGALAVVSTVLIAPGHA